MKLLFIQIGSHKNTDPKSRCTQYKLVLNWHDSRDANVVVVYAPTATFGKKEFPRKVTNISAGVIAPSQYKQ